MLSNLLIQTTTGRLHCSGNFSYLVLKYLYDVFLKTMFRSAGEGKGIPRFYHMLLTKENTPKKCKQFNVEVFEKEVQSKLKGLST